MTLWSEYWVWFALALALGIAEILAPGFILLGFAIGAGVVGLVMAIGGPLGDYFAGSLPITLVLFGALSLIAWLILRQIFKLKTGQVKNFDHDINEG